MPQTLTDDGEFFGVELDDETQFDQSDVDRQWVSQLLAELTADKWVNHDCIAVLPEWRKPPGGADVNFVDILNVFGFASANVEMVTSQEQHAANLIFDGFCDLQDILQVPPQVISR